MRRLAKPTVTGSFATMRLPEPLHPESFGADAEGAVTRDRNGYLLEDQLEGEGLRGSSSLMASEG